MIGPDDASDREHDGEEGRARPRARGRIDHRHTCRCGARWANCYAPGCGMGRYIPCGDQCAAAARPKWIRNLRR